MQTFRMCESEGRLLENKIMNSFHTWSTQLFTVFSRTWGSRSEHVTPQPCGDLHPAHDERVG